MIAWKLVIGFIVLLFGRNLFWLLVATVGFVYGFELAQRLFPEQSELLIWLVALLAGVIGAVLAYFFQWVMLAVAGFLIGGRLALTLLVVLGAEPTGWATVIFLLGGIIGAVIVLAVFDWALIVISSVFGALLVVEAVDLGPTLAIGLFLMLAIVGAVVQTSLMAPGRPARHG